MDFPAKTKNASEGDIAVSTIAFQDKISIMVSRNGKIGKFYSVPLTASVVSSAGLAGLSSGGLESDDDMYPLPHLTPTALVGGTDDDIQGQLFATQIASIVSRQSPEETRTVVVGLAGSIGPRPDQEEITKEHKQQLLRVIDLVQRCKVW